jgi:outer membrane protein OmpA-like peptidoglycan-associated protein
MSRRTNPEHRRLHSGLLALAAALLFGCAKPPAAPVPAAPPPAPEPAPAIKLSMSQTDRGVLIWLPDHVLFEFGKADLAPAAAEYLDRVGHLIARKTERQTAVEGHTDSIGSLDYNQGLSERRARAVAQALVARGVPNSRIQTSGFAFKRPLAPNDSELGRRLNRRVELIVIDETVANLMRDEPPNAFEDAFARLKQELEREARPGGAGR